MTRLRCHTARIGIEALEHREVPAVVLAATPNVYTLTQAPPARVATSIPVTPLQTQTPVKADVPLSRDQLISSRATPNLATQAQAVLAGKQPGAALLDPFAKAQPGKGLFDVGLSTVPPSQIAEVSKGVQSALDDLGFGVAPRLGGGNGVTVTPSSSTTASVGGSGSLTRPDLKNPPDDRLALLDTLFGTTAKTPGDVAKDGLARGYNIGDPGQWSGSLSFLEGEMIVLGREQDLRGSDKGGTKGEYDEVYGYATRNGDGTYTLGRNGGGADQIAGKDTVHEGDGFLIVKVGNAREVVPIAGESIQGKPERGKEQTIVPLVGVEKNAGGLTEVVIPKDSSLIAVFVQNKDGKHVAAYAVDSDLKSKDNPRPSSTPAPAPAPSGPDKKEKPAPDKDWSAGTGPATPRVTTEHLKLPGQEGAGKGASPASVDKLIKGTVVLAISKVNPPPDKPELDGGNASIGGIIGGDPADELGGGTMPTTFKGPKPTPGPGGRIPK